MPSSARRCSIMGLLQLWNQEITDESAEIIARRKARCRLEPLAADQRKEKRRLNALERDLGARLHAAELVDDIDDARLKTLEIIDRFERPGMAQNGHDRACDIADMHQIDRSIVKCDLRVPAVASGGEQVDDRACRALIPEPLPEHQ